MFRRLHLKMTIFCTLVTGFILIAMTFAGLYIFEDLLDKNDLAVFEKNRNSVLDYLEGAAVVDYTHLGKLTSSDMYTVAIFEGDRQLSLHSQSQYQLIRAVCQKARDDYSFDVYNPPTSRTATKYLDFEMTYDKTARLATFASLPNKYGSICVLILYSRTQLESQTAGLRIAFLLIDGAALVLLFLFAWKFSGHILLPVEKNRKKQVQFVAAASHELRTPLAVILAGIDALKAAPEEDRADFYRSIESEGQRMKRLIDDMLSLANADNQSWSVHFDAAELDTLLLDCYDKYLPLSRKKDLHLRISLPEDPLPPCLCDRQRIEQVVGILLDNAFCYTPKSGGITLGIDYEKNRLKIWVADTGPGIPDEEKEQVFDRFYRSDSSRKERQHFGLGLCIAKEIIKLHRGKIWVEDNAPQGTIFYITLPEHTASPSRP